MLVILFMLVVTIIVMIIWFFNLFMIIVCLLFSLIQLFYYLIPLFLIFEHQPIFYTFLYLSISLILRFTFIINSLYTPSSPSPNLPKSPISLSINPLSPPLSQTIIACAISYNSIAFIFFMLLINEVFGFIICIL